MLLNRAIKYTESSPPQLTFRTSDHVQTRTGTITFLAIMSHRKQLSQKDLLNSRKDSVNEAKIS